LVQPRKREEYVGGWAKRDGRIIETGMATPKILLSELPWNEHFRFTGADDVLTPALLLYPDAIAANIQRTIQLLDGDAARWRVHVKTAKLAYTFRLYLDHGLRFFKCATTLELLMACREGAHDVLLAYPVMGPNAQRAREIAAQFPRTRISVLIENDVQLAPWRGSSVGIFVDLNSGMNRTGIEASHPAEIMKVARAVRTAGLEFRGLHFYDGHLGSVAEPERTAIAHAGYDALLKIVAELEAGDVPVAEVITSGTPAFPCSLSYADFRMGKFAHRASPGTVVYNDASSLAQLPDLGYQAAALVLARVVSNPRPGIVTCDAGHKAVSADAGVPTCVVVGHPELTPLTPSEEHLPIAVRDGAAAPQVGDTIFLLPRHVCPTVNNFDHALLVRDGKILAQEGVSARGHEAPLLATATATAKN
jgi:D-serine deaminase-like pyridoxal phosphate-dependent protein